MLKIDFHIHSVNSGHAYGNYYQIVKEAKSKAMDMIAITDHGPSMNGTLGWIHFGMGRRQPKIEGLKVYWGCELNIIDEDGNVDLPEDQLQKLDIILLGFHRCCPYNDLGFERNTKAFLKALDNPHIQIISHPSNHQFPCDWEKILSIAIEKGIIPELNLSYLFRAKLDEKQMIDFKKMISIVQEKGARFLINSDAHFIHEIGDDSLLKKYWDELNLSEDLFWNNSPEELKEKLKLK